MTRSEKMDIDDYAQMIVDEGEEIIDTEECDEEVECSFCEKAANYLDENHDVYFCDEHHYESQERIDELMEE